MSTAQVLLPSQPPMMRMPPITINTALQSDRRAAPETSAELDRGGAYHLDKVLKSGWLLKRTRKTKGWKRRWFVLRADRLSCYKDQKEYKMHRQILLTDVTAVAALKDVKQPCVFGVFLSNRTFHFQGATEADTAEWVAKIRSAVIVDGDDDMVLNSPLQPDDTMILASPASMHPSSGGNRLGSSSSDFGSPVGPSFRGAGRLSTQTLDYSGPDVGSVSSISDGARISQLSLAHAGAVLSDNEQQQQQQQQQPPPPPEPKIVRNESGLSQHTGLPRVIWHGFLYCLKSTRGVKQWKKYWIVVRNVNIAFYKNEEEYKAVKLLPLDNVVDAVEIDPLSKSKKHCLQIITEGKSYRFAARDEEVLAQSLGAMKSTLARKRGVAVAVASPQAQTAPSLPAPMPAAAVGAAATQVSATQASAAAAQPKAPPPP